MTSDSTTVELEYLRNAKTCHVWRAGARELFGDDRAGIADGARVAGRAGRLRTDGIGYSNWTSFEALHTRWRDPGHDAVLTCVKPRTQDRW